VSERAVAWAFGDAIGEAFGDESGRSREELMGDMIDLLHAANKATGRLAHILVVRARLRYLL